MNSSYLCQEFISFRLCRCAYACLNARVSVLRSGTVCVGSVVHTSAPPALLGRALVRLQLEELFGHLVVVALREDAEDGEARLVHVDTFAEREPDGGAAAGRQLLQLKHSYAHGPVLTRKTVILHTHLQLVTLGTQLTAQHTREGARDTITSASPNTDRILYSIPILSVFF